MLLAEIGDDSAADDLEAFLKMPDEVSGKILRVSVLGHYCDP